MPDLKEYSQYQCEICGFRTRSPDREEVVEIVTNHAARKHDETLGREDVEGELRTLELEGYPDNA